MVAGLSGKWATRAHSIVAIAVAATGSFEHHARADDTKAQCIAAHEAAQLHRRQSELLAAREKLRVCAHNACPNIVQTDCIDWLDEVERSIPSIILEAREADRDLFDVQVALDGVPLASRLDGKPLDLDPGAHTFRFEAAGKAPQDVRALVKAGEKNRVVTATWDRPRPTTTPGGDEKRGAAPAERPIPRPVFIAAGVGVAGVLAFAIFGALGVSKKNDLTASCAPFCQDSDIQSARSRFIAADVSLGFAVVGFATAAVLFLSRPEQPLRAARSRLESNPTPGTPRPDEGRPPAPRLSVRALGGSAMGTGALATFEGRF